MSVVSYRVIDGLMLKFIAIHYKKVVGDIV